MNRPIKILFVVTSHNQIDATHPTGVWLEEFAVPYGEFKRAGYEISVASPRGGVTPIDPASAPDREQRLLWTEASRLLQHTRRLDAMRATDYDAIFLPGGHGAMFDLPESAELQALLVEFAMQDKVIASICHGSAAFVNVKLANGRSLVYGRTLTGMTDAEEQEAQFDNLMPFLLETRLRHEGASFITGPNWINHREQDGNLITGQNPQSSRATARAVVQKLEQRAHRPICA
jgi:putative intracellular protease/amidase